MASSGLDPLIEAEAVRSGGTALETLDAAPAPFERVEMVPDRPSLLEGLRGAWACRHVVPGMSAQFLRFHQPNMILGAWWIPIRLVFNSVAMGFIFGSLLNVPSAPGVPYLLFVTVGAMAWWLFERGTRSTMQSFHRLRSYVMNLTFPLVLVPFAGIVALAIPLGFIAIFLMCVFLVYLGIDGQLYVQPEAVFLVPLSVTWLILAAIAVGLFTGPIFVRARDVRQLFRLALPFWMYVTPVVYPIESLSATLQWVALANPLAPPVLLFKQGLLGTEGPPLWSLGAGLVTTTIAVFAGLWFTNRYGRSILMREPERDEDDDDLS